MVKFWRYYKYYFCTLWKRPLVWLLTGGMIYAQYQQEWQVQAAIYVAFALLLPLAVACERIRADFELEDIANGLAERDAKREARRAGTVPTPIAETEIEEQDPFDDSRTDEFPPKSDSFDIDSDDPEIY